MFKQIISINKNNTEILIDEKSISEDILNYYVVFTDESKQILGEISEVNKDKVKINFLGELKEGKFISGIIRKPSLNSQIRIINDEELKILIGEETDNNMVLGLSPLYQDKTIYININDMFSNHSAIFGNTGSGKTYGVSRLVQNLFTKQNIIPFYSNIFIFNSTNEYDNAFSSINKINPNFNYKIFTTNTNQSNIPILKIPLWQLSSDDYANLLDVTEYSQINIIDKMLIYVSAFAKNDEYSIKYKNHLISSAIISVLYTNQTSARIRDQIFNILTICNTNELNLDVEIQGVGYTRQLRKCFDIDSKGDFVERLLVTQYIENFLSPNTKWKEEYEEVFYTLDDLEEALNFTLISEGLLLNDKYYAEAIALKVKLHTICNSSYKKFFNYDKFITLNEYINELVMLSPNKRCQIINFVLEDIDDRMAKALTKIYSRLIFKFSRNLKERGAFPILIMLDEAHRYV